MIKTALLGMYPVGRSFYPRRRFEWGVTDERSGAVVHYGGCDWWYFSSGEITGSCAAGARWRDGDLRYFCGSKAMDMVVGVLGIALSDAFFYKPIANKRSFLLS